MPEDAVEQGLPHLQTGSYRFSREIDSLAPKPGHSLGTITCNKNGRALLLRVIEGAHRDSMSFRGMITDFQTTTLLNFHLSGPSIDLFEDLPYSPFDISTDIQYRDIIFDGTNVQIPKSINAKVIYSRIASERGLDPDGAIIMYSIPDSQSSSPDSSSMLPPDRAFLTGFKRGWCPMATIVVVGLVCLTVYGLARLPGIKVRGAVSVAGVKADVDVETKSGPSTAPVGSSSTSKP